MRADIYELLIGNKGTRGTPGVTVPLVSALDQQPNIEIGPG